jgi:hypothetical protein
MLPVAAVLFAPACGQARSLGAAATPTPGPLVPMIITNVQLDITVEDIAATEQQLAFIERFDGYIADVRHEDADGRPALIADLRTPSEHIDRILEILRTELGEVTYFNVWSADISVRYAKLLRELAELEASVQGLSATEAIDASQRIEHLRGMIAFREEREAYDSILLHLVEGP